MDQQPKPSSFPFGNNGVIMQHVAQSPHQVNAQHDGMSLKQSVLIMIMMMLNDNDN
jgi:hypothetical protein